MYFWNSFTKDLTFISLKYFWNSFTKDLCKLNFHIVKVLSRDFTKDLNQNTPTTFLC